MSFRSEILISCSIIVLMLNMFHDVNAQKKEELQQRKEKTLEDIRTSNELLKETQINRKNNLNRIRIVDKRIALRNEMVSTISEQIDDLNNKMEDLNELLLQMEKDYEKVKEEYKKLVYYSYWNRNQYDRLMFVLSAKSFNQAYKRLKYLQQMAGFRRKQAEEIMAIREKLEEKNKELMDAREEKRELLSERLIEIENLNMEKSSKETLVGQLKKEESRLRAEINRKKATAKKLEDEITRIIEEERRKAAKENRNAKLTPEEQLISEKFGENKGRLPWPTERGIITNKFGRHAHPVLPGITIENNGIDITTVEGAAVRSIYEGEVTRVFPLMGANYVVIIRHGDYLSVYGNLSNVLVRKGDKVSTKQKIGTVFTDSGTKDTILHMEIWKELQKQNPELWISPVR